MARKQIAHGVFRIPEAEKDSWVCSFRNCKRKGIVIVLKQYDDGTETHGGGCYKCVLRWQKDCPTCLDKLEEAKAAE